MSRFLTLATAAALAICVGATWSHGDQAGGGGGGGAGGGGQAGGTGTAGGTGQAGATGQTGGIGTPASAGANANAQGRAGITPQFNDTPNNFNNFGVGRRPFFADPNVRRQLSLNDNQFNRLNQSYVDAWSNFDRGRTGLNNNLTAQQREQQMMQLQNRFNQTFGQTVDSTFTDPRVRTRFNQLSLQFQGPGAFNDPMIRQRLNLTPQQQREFRRLSAEWRQQLQRLRRAGRDADPQLTQQQFAQLQQQFQDQVGTVLTPQQQQMWPELTGSPYVYPFNSYGVDLPGGNFAHGGANGAAPGAVDQQQQPAATPQGTATQPGQGTVR